MVSRIFGPEKKRGDKKKKPFSFFEREKLFFGFSQIIFRGFFHCRPSVYFSLIHKLPFSSPFQLLGNAPMYMHEL